MSILSHIQTHSKANGKMLAILLDPEKTALTDLNRRTESADLVFVGGSTGEGADRLTEALKKQTDKPVILFPGNIQQITDQADALLFLSVLSSRNAEMLIGRQIEAARAVRQSGIETIPMGYILIDGGTHSSVEHTTRSQPIPQTDIEQIVSTAIAAELLGMRLVYLEAGSGAKTPVSTDIIRAVRQAVSLPLIVGGGICTPEQMQQAFNAGADVVVIGNHFERHPEQIPLFRINESAGIKASANIG